MLGNKDDRGMNDASVAERAAEMKVSDESGVRRRSDQHAGVISRPFHPRLSS